MAQPCRGNHGMRGYRLTNAKRIDGDSVRQRYDDLATRANKKFVPMTASVANRREKPDDAPAPNDKWKALPLSWQRIKQNRPRNCSRIMIEHFPF